MKSKRRSTSPETSPSPMESMAEDSTPSPFHHNDLIKDILSRLPIKYIKRFESVSKLWYSLINSDDFISAHLRRTSRRPTLLIHRFHNPTGSYFTISLIDSLNAILRDVRVPFLNSVIRFPKIVGSCNGILCLDISPCYARSFVLWNISTRQFRLLPRPRINDSRRAYWMVATGFGHNPDTNDYKLVRIVNFQSKLDESHIVRAEVFSWITGTWRLIDVKKTDAKLASWVTHEGQYAKTMNDSFCWIANKFGDFGNRRCIVSFDLATEEFRQIPVPDFSAGVCCKIIKFKESLGLAVYAGSGRPLNRIELWVFEEKCNDNGSSMYWDKLHTIDLDFPGIPIGVYNDTELLIKRVDSQCVTLTFYDPYNESYKNVPMCNSEFSCEFYSYVDSLVPVISAGDELLEEDEEEEAEAEAME
ncbi:putative F-box protein At3g16210 [Euphorbia lathyris]|uniref:putative F-box protein At3g16210 n=1 Tax=Euphorbia lathyris TaxID=212925 RepID=UPI0033142B52